MHCIDPIAKGRPGTLVAAAAFAVLALAGCAGSDQAPGETRGGVPPIIKPAPPPPLPIVPPSPGVAPSRLPPPATMRSWNEVRRQAAERLIAANPDITYRTKPPDILLGIPVLEIELNGDGSIRRIEVLREPREAKDTIKIAADAVRRAAPFGDVSRLPRPWKFVETFLFDNSRKFKPRTLDN